MNSQSLHSTANWSRTEFGSTLGLGEGRERELSEEDSCEGLIITDSRVDWEFEREGGLLRGGAGVPLTEGADETLRGAFLTLTDGAEEALKERKGVTLD